MLGRSACRKGHWPIEPPHRTGLASLALLLIERRVGPADEVSRQLTRAGRGASDADRHPKHGGYLLEGFRIVHRLPQRVLQPLHLMRHAPAHQDREFITAQPPE